MPIKNGTEIKTQKTALYILLIYMACQLSSFLLLIFPAWKERLFDSIDAATREDKAVILSGYWSTIAFGIALVFILLLVARNKNFWNVFDGEKETIGKSIGWGVIGFFLIYFGQTIGGVIESLIGVKVGSDNTAELGSIMAQAPIMILAIVVFGPILEELVFRRVIFGSLIQKYNFFVSALVSGIVFAAIHLEFEHIILYTICGFVFAFLYYKTKRIITSIIAHMMLNGFVAILQYNYDVIMEFLKKIEKASMTAMIFF